MTASKTRGRKVKKVGRTIGRETYKRKKK